MCVFRPANESFPATARPDDIDMTYAFPEWISASDGDFACQGWEDEASRAMDWEEEQAYMELILGDCPDLDRYRDSDGDDTWED